MDMNNRKMKNIHPPPYIIHKKFMMPKEHPNIVKKIYKNQAYMREPTKNLISVVNTIRNKFIFHIQASRN